MKFKSVNPGFSSLESKENLYAYIEDLKSEMEAKLTYMENTIEKIKEMLDSIKGADV